MQACVRTIMTEVAASIGGRGEPGHKERGKNAVFFGNLIKSSSDREGKKYFYLAVKCFDVSSLWLLLKCFLIGG